MHSRALPRSSRSRSRSHPMSSPRRIALRVAGTMVAVESDVPEAMSYLELVLGELIQPSSVKAQTYRVSAASRPRETTVVTPDGDVAAFASPIKAAEFVQWHLTQTSLSQARERFALHAAGVIERPSRGALVLVGPSGSGKSTLTRELLLRGLGFLSDEAVLLSRDGTSVTGFPRALGFLPPDAPATPAAEIAKTYVPARILTSSIVEDSVPIGMVCFLEGFGPSP